MKIFTNQSTYFYGEFQKLFKKTSIDHRTISWNHFEVDGLVKMGGADDETRFTKIWTPKMPYLILGPMITMASYGL